MSEVRGGRMNVKMIDNRTTEYEAEEKRVTDEYAQAISRDTGERASAVRLAERLRSIADEMRSVGASSMTPHELLACYANDVDKVADSLMFAATLGSESNGDTELENADSREKLEADVRKHYAYSTTTLMYPPSVNKTTDMLHALPVDTVIGWLDRQAAITKRETLHDNPTCSGRSTCASKDEIRDVDIWNVAYEIYCAGGYVDNGNEPNPPTDGIRKLLDRQAEITREEADAGCNECFTEARKREHTLGEAIDDLADQVGLERRKAIELTNAINELQKKQPYCYNPEQPLDSLNTIGRYIDELTAERDNLKANNEQLHTLAGEQAATIDELTAERDNLKELNEYHAHQYELASEDIDRMHAQVDELNATIGKLQKQVNELMIR